MVYNDLFNYGLFIHMTYLSYGRMSPQQKNNQQSSVFDMLYAFDWHYLYVSLSWKDGRRSIFQSISMFWLVRWHHDKRHSLAKILIFLVSGYAKNKFCL